MNNETVLQILIILTISISILGMYIAVLITKVLKYEKKQLEIQSNSEVNVPVEVAEELVVNIEETKDRMNAKEDVNQNDIKTNEFFLDIEDSTNEVEKEIRNNVSSNKQLDDFTFSIEDTKKVEKKDDLVPRILTTNQFKDENVIINTDADVEVLKF